jgi:hypothetical protein
MKVLINNENGFEIPFEGWTYSIPSKKEILVEDEVAVFLQERYPWITTSFPSQAKDAPVIPSVERQKTPVLLKTDEEKAALKTQDMVVTRGPRIDDTIPQGDGLPISGTVDKDGIEWTGEGIEPDHI